MAIITTLQFRSVSSYNYTANAGGNNFRFHIRYSVSDDSYFMDIDIMRNNVYEPIAHCIRLCVGADLFIPFRRYGLGSLFIVPTDNRYIKETGPNSDNILTAYKMVWEHD